MRIPLLRLFAPALTLMFTGCATPNGDDGSLVDAVAIGATMLPTAVIASPVLLLWYGGHIIGEGAKDHIQATPGTSETDFEDGIREAEGIEGRYLRPEIRHESDDTYRSIYRFKKRVYRGHFTQEGIAIKY
jgi:hypothetical protein